MTKKLNSILLIDDDKATNYIHQRVLAEVGCAEKVVAVESGYDALDFLNERISGLDPELDLIFLDINMPGMTGWEFLEHYKELNLSNQAKAVLIMLTTSLNPDDLENASKMSGIDGFETKPLDADKIEKALKNHFSE